MHASDARRIAKRSTPESPEVKRILSLIKDMAEIGRYYVGAIGITSDETVKRLHKLGYFTFKQEAPHSAVAWYKITWNNK